MSPESQRGPAGSRHKLADILAAEAMAFEGGPEPSPAQIPAGRGTRRAPNKPDEAAASGAAGAAGEPATTVEPIAVVEAVVAVETTTAVPAVTAVEAEPRLSAKPLALPVAELETEPRPGATETPAELESAPAAEPKRPADAEQTADARQTAEPATTFDAFAAPIPSIADILESSFRVPEQRPASEPEVAFRPPPFAPQPVPSLPQRAPMAELERPSSPASAPASSPPSSPSSSEPELGAEPETEPEAEAKIKPEFALAPESALDSTMVIFPPMPKGPPSGLDLEAALPVVPEAFVETPAKTPATPSTPKAPASSPASSPASDGAGHSASPRWQENVPFDETGVLLRPDVLRARAMADETELISAIKVQDDGSEAAQAQRPGFWTGAWARRGMVAVILLLQSILSLRNNNTAFEDEALYLYSGHLELGHLLYGTSTGTDFWSYFSGAPVLYPVLGSVADQMGGLFGARLLSLSFMLGATCMLYLITRRMFGTRAAVCAAALFCCTEPVVFVGNLATYDAPALFLIAFSAWIVVRFARSTWPLYLLAIFPAVLAVGTKYAALMFVPIIVCLAFLAAVPHFGKWALLRPIALALGFTGVVYAVLKMTDNLALQGVQSTTTNRAQGNNTLTQVMQLSLEWGGALFVVSLAGAAFLVALPREHGLPYLPASRWLRVCLAALMCGTALLPPLYQAHLHTTVSLQKHVGFGLFFAAPLAGYGLVRLVGPHLHRAQLGIGVLVITFSLGMGQSLGLFHGWPNSSTLVQEIAKYQKPNANYLVGADEVAIYSLRGDLDAEPLQFSNTFVFNYTDSKGQFLTGPAAYTAAIQAGYFQVIAYTGNDDSANEAVIAAALYRAKNYKLVTTIPEVTSYGLTHYYVWVKR